MGTITSAVGRIGRRTALAIAGGVAVVAATVAVATAAVAGGGPVTPAPTSSPSSSVPSAPAGGAPRTSPGDDGSDGGREACCGGDGAEIGKSAMDDGTEMGKEHMDDGLEMGSGMGDG
ncbi:hypothetical protein ACWGQ5_11935 [Streptomyces sp. NPDC055722]